MKPPFIILFCFITLISRPQSLNENIGAIAVGMSGAGITQKNVWSAANNIGVLGAIDEFEVGMAYENKFSLTNLGLKSLVASAPLSKGALGIYAHQFGYHAYSENKLGLGYGIRLSKQLSLGVQFNYHDVRFGDVYGRRNAFTGSVGMLVQPKNHISFGVVIHNPTRSKFVGFSEEVIPSKISISGQFDFSKKACAILQADKGINQPLDVIAALQYNPAKNLAIRAGYASARNSMSFGFGYFWKKISADVAAMWHQTLGFTTSFSLSYKLKKRKKRQ